MSATRMRDLDRLAALQKHLLGFVPRWDKEQLPKRWYRCVSMLYLHGLLTDGERNRVRERIAKRLTEADVSLVVLPAEPPEPEGTSQ